MAEQKKPVADHPADEEVRKSNQAALDRMQKEAEERAEAQDNPPDEPISKRTKAKPE